MAVNLPPIVADPALTVYLRALEAEVKRLSRKQGFTQSAAETATSAASTNATWTQDSTSSQTITNDSLAADITYLASPPSEVTNLGGWWEARYHGSDVNPSWTARVFWQAPDSNGLDEDGGTIAPMATVYEGSISIDPESGSGFGYTPIPDADGMLPGQFSVLIEMGYGVDPVANPQTSVGLAARSPTGGLGPVTRVDFPTDLGPKLDQPSAPTLSTVDGEVTVTWDGLKQGGGAYADFEVDGSLVILRQEDDGFYYVVDEYRPESSTPAQLGPVTVVLKDQGPGETRSYKLAVSTWRGYRSNQSTAAGVTVAGLTLDVSDIPDLPASKTTSGAFDLARIPDLPASKTTSGAFDKARIPATLNDTTIPNLTASTVNTAGGDITIGDASSRIYIPGSAHSRRLVRNNTKGTANATWTLLDGGYADNQTNIGGIGYTAGVLTVPVDGLYIITAGATFAGTSGAGLRICRINLPGGANIESPSSTQIGTSNIRTTLTIVRRLNAGESVSMSAYQSSGASLNVIPDPASILEVTLITRL